VPRGRPPKSVDPDASCAARLGAEIRACRAAQNLTLHGLARRIGYSPQHISDAELAKSAVSQHFVATVDRVLDARGRLVALYPAVVIEREIERQKRVAARREALRCVQEVGDVKRRAFIGLGLSVVLLGPEAATRASADDWDRIGHAWGYEIATAPDRTALLPGLAADLKRLHTARGPQRTIALLSSYVASIAVSGGDTAVAKRWWRRARVAATSTADPHLTAYVTSQQAVQGLYGAYTPDQIITLADEALSATSTPCTGRMNALGARAQALAMLGRERPASDALATLERTFEQLPRDIMREKLSMLGWPEECLHHVRSYCAMYGSEGGDSAREDALRLYAAADWRGPAQVKLHRAASEVDAKDAVATLNHLSDAQRSDRFVRRIATHVLDRVNRAGSASGTAELREQLTA
jgi:transcriptional regulator with XRE-family HTH domain